MLSTVSENFIWLVPICNNCIFQQCMFFFKNFIEMRTKVKAVTRSYVKLIPVGQIFIHINNLFSQLKDGTGNCHSISQVYSKGNSYNETI